MVFSSTVTTSSAATSVVTVLFLKTCTSGLRGAGGAELVGVHSFTLCSYVTSRVPREKESEAEREREREQMCKKPKT